MAGVELDVFFGHESCALIFGDSLAGVFDVDFYDFAAGAASAESNLAFFGTQDGILDEGFELLGECALLYVRGEGGVGEVEIEGDFFTLAER